MAKYRRAFFSILIFSLLILAACRPKAVLRPRLFFSPSEKAWVEKVLARMTLEEKIGQMVACSYSGQFVNKDSDALKRLEHLIVERKIGWPFSALS